MKSKNKKGSNKSSFFFWQSIRHKQIAFYIVIFFVFLGLALSTSFKYQRVVDLPNRVDRINLHNAILQNKANSPYRYRVLYPYLTQLVIRFYPSLYIFDINSIDPSINVGSFSLQQIRFAQAWYLLDTIAFFLIFLCIYLFLNKFSIGYRLLGCYLSYNALNAILIGHAYQPWSLFEGFLFPLAFFIADKINSRKDKKAILFYFILVIISCLNRETGIFIAVFFLIQIFLERKVKELGIYGGLFFIVSIVILALLRFSKGSAVSEITIQQIFFINNSGANINLLKYELWNMFLFFWMPILLGMLWFSKRNLKYYILILMYVPFYLIFGIWGEVRLLIPLMSILIFFGVSFFENSVSLYTKGQYK